jgi:hypothetical protein
LGRKIVLIEGSNSSLDKLAYGSILNQRFPQFVMVASGGKHAIESFAHVHAAVLSRSLWGVEFFMLCDGDSRPAGGESADGRLAVLPRYHLENYFLDEHVWAHAFSVLVEAGSWLRSPDQVREKLRELAEREVSFAVALKIAADVRLQCGNVSIMPKECRGLTEDELVAKLQSAISAEASRVETAMDSAQAEASARSAYAAIKRSLAEDTDEWKTLVPAKPLLGGFAGTAGVKIGHAKKLYVDAALVSESDVFKDVIQIFQTFADAGTASRTTP